MKGIMTIVTALGLAVSPVAAGHHGHVTFARGHNYNFGHAYNTTYVAATPVIATSVVYAVPTVVVAQPAVAYPVVTAPVVKAPRVTEVTPILDPAPEYTPPVVTAPTYCAPVTYSAQTVVAAPLVTYNATATYASGYTSYRAHNVTSGYFNAPVIVTKSRFNAPVIAKSGHGRVRSRPVVVQAGNTKVVARGARAVRGR